MRKALLGFLFLLIATAVHGQRLEPHSIDKLMTGTMKAWQIPGAALAVVQNDRIIYVKGYGTKEAGGTEPVTHETLFQIASTSKAFTTTALAMLVAEGKIQWDDPVRKHLDYFRLAEPCADAQVTVRDIVSHRTGLARHDELWDNSPFPRDEVVRRIGHVALTKPFRSAYQYQNIMFIAAGELVRAVSGMPWDDFVKTRIFQPLGMARTVISDADWAASNHATGYRWDSVKQRLSPMPPNDTSAIGAGGAIKSNAIDMAQWVRFQLADGFYDGRALVPSEILSETKRPQTVIRIEHLIRDANPETSLMSYGMGWTVQDYRGDLLVSHAGALNGFRTHVDLLPRRGLGFVVMVNAGRGMAVVALRNALIDMLTGKQPRDWNAYYLMVDARADDRDLKEKQERIAKRRPDTKPSHPLADYTGEYESPAHGTVRITAAGEQLLLQWNRMNVPLAHWHYDVFAAVSEPDDLDEQVAFGMNADGEVKTLTFFGEAFTRK